MRLPRSLSYLVDNGFSAEGADDFLAALGAELIEDGLPLAGGALSQAPPHPIIARRTWLWRADTGRVVEAVGLAGSGMADAQHAAMSRDWLAAIGQASQEEHPVGSMSDRTTLSWSSREALSEAELTLLRDAARFASAPLAAIVARSTTATLLETYLGRRSAGRVLSGRLRREPGETIRAALLFADMRGFTALSEASRPEDVIAALDAWFDRIGGAVHAFGGEVLKFIGDGLLAIFPIGDRTAAEACDRALRAVASARAGMRHLDDGRAAESLPPLPFGVALHVGEMLWGNIGTANRLDFTAIGPAVNLVSRLEGLCRPLGRALLVSEAFAAETTQPLQALGRHRLRGIVTPCAVYGMPE